jgi:outer membrane protein OmpA-like peptidoglycan-associated protein
MDERIRFIEHKGKPILLLDFSVATATQMLPLLMKVQTSVAKQGPKAVLVLADYLGAEIDHKVAMRIKEVLALGGETSCMASFIVKQPPKHPPVVGCSADPSTVQAGSSSTISCSCTSPDNVPVTVGNWTASGGSISNGSGNSASLNTTGASAGPITVSANCTDARGLNTPATAQVLVEVPPQPSPEFVQLEHRLALHSIYFPTDQPRIEHPDGGLLPSQEQTLTSLADDFKKYLDTKPDAHLILEGHADPRGSVQYNQSLSERRVERSKRFLIEHGVPEANLETKALGEQHNLTEDQVKDAVEKNPELTPEQRQKVRANLRTILLASNRRVDITLNTTGQQSIREYPFNAADSLTLLQQEGKRKGSAAAPRKKCSLWLSHETVARRICYQWQMITFVAFPSACG